MLLLLVHTLHNILNGSVGWIVTHELFYHSPIWTVSFFFQGFAIINTTDKLISLVKMLTIFIALIFVVVHFPNVKYLFLVIQILSLIHKGLYDIFIVSIGYSAKMLLFLLEE